MCTPIEAEEELYDVMTEADTIRCKLMKNKRGLEESDNKHKQCKRPKVHMLEQHKRFLLREQNGNKFHLKMLKETAIKSMKDLRIMRSKIQNKTELYPFLINRDGSKFQQLLGIILSCQNRDTENCAGTSTAHIKQSDSLPLPSITLNQEQKSTTLDAVRMRNRWRNELQHIGSLETSLPKLVQENQVYKLRILILQQKITTLVNEIKGLACMIENASGLSKFVTTIRSPSLQWN